MFLAIEGAGLSENHFLKGGRIKNTGCISATADQVFSFWQMCSCGSVDFEGTGNARLYVK